MLDRGLCGNGTTFGLCDLELDDCEKLFDGGRYDYLAPPIRYVEVVIKSPTGRKLIILSGGNEKNKAIAVRNFMRQEVKCANIRSRMASQ